MSNLVDGDRCFKDGHIYKWRDGNWWRQVAVEEAVKRESLVPLFVSCLERACWFMAGFGLGGGFVLWLKTW